MKVERINGLNEELHDRAVSAELQIQALSDEYRSVIEQKEVYMIFIKVTLYQKSPLFEDIRVPGDPEKIDPRQSVVERRQVAT